MQATVAVYHKQLAPTKGALKANSAAFAALWIANSGKAAAQAPAKPRGGQQWNARQRLMATSCR